MTASTMANASAAARAWKAYALVACLAFLSGVFGIARVQVMDADEARFAQASRQMIESNDYVNIRLQDRERNRKPAGIHWLQTLSVRAFEPLTHSINQIWTYRAPSVLGLVLAALATLWAGRALLNERVALIGAALFSVGLLVGFEGMSARTDAVLLGFTTLALAALARLRAKEDAPLSARRPIALIFWAAIGCGLLVKGPVTPLIAGVLLLVLALWERRSAWMKPLAWWPGPILALLIAMPWAIAIAISTEGRFYTQLLANEVGPKVAGADHRHTGIFGYYLLLLPILMFPATYALPAGVRALLAREDQEGAPPAAIRFLTAWAGLTLLIFELFPAKLVHYVMPALPAVALLSGAGIWLAVQENWRRVHVGGVALFAGVGALLIIALTLGLREVSSLNVTTLIPLAGMAAALGVAAIALYLAPRARDRAAIIIAIGLLFSFSVREIIVANASGIRVSERVAETLFRVFPDARSGARPVWIVGYDEPSVVFLTHTSVHLAAPDALSAVRAGDIIIVESRQREPVRGALAAQGLRFSPAATPIIGTSMSDSEFVELTLGEAEFEPRATVSAALPRPSTQH